MKRVLAIILTLFLIPAHADLRHEHWHGHGGYYRGGNDWIAPALIGGIIGYELSRPAPQPQVIYTPPPVVYTPAPPPPPYGYHYINILDANCNCYRTVLTPN